MYEEGVSICITAYKSQEFIKECLDSVANQTWFKTHNNWEILLGIDGCANTLHCVHSIMGNYKNLRVFMMNSNKGTYVTSNTIMKQAKYSGLIRFDSDDIMLPNMVERIMTEKKWYDIVRFKMMNFGTNRTKGTAVGQIYIKHNTFDKFGGYMPFPCSADAELLKRLKKFVKINKLNDILFKRRIHKNNLTVSSKTNFESPIRQSIGKVIDNEHFRFEKDAIIECKTNTFIEIFKDSDISKYPVKPEEEKVEMKISNKRKQLILRRVNKQSFKNHVLL